MASGRVLMFVAMAGGGLYWVSTHHHDPLAGGSPGAFVPVAMPDGAQPDTVIILAPLNCPSDAAQRADRLAADLTGRGFRVVRSNSFQAQIDNPTEEQNASLQRAAAVLNGTIPAVFLNGKAKSNPTAAEVAAELTKGK